MDDKKIGKFIRELREEAGMSQGELADLCYVSRTVEGRWELGKIGVTSQNLIYLSNIFDISVDELLAGERKSKKSSSKLSDIMLNEIDKNAKLRKIIKRTLIGLLLLAFAFFVYFFYTFYNSVQVYKIYFDSNKYLADYGLVTKMKDKIYFYLDINYAIDNYEDIEEVHLFYDDNSNVKTIKKITNIQPFIIVDYLGYEEYFDFSKLDKILDNMYLEVKFKNEETDKIKVFFKRDYVNNKVLLNKDKVSAEEKNLDNISDKSEIYSKFEKIKEIAKNHGDENYLEYELDGTNYEMFIDDDNLMIKFLSVSSSYSYNYVFLETCKEYFSLNILTEEDKKEIYRMDIHTNKCDNGDCTNYNTDFEEFIKLLNSIINNN